MSRNALGLWAGGLLYLGFVALLLWAAGGIPRDTTTLVAMAVLIFGGGLFIGMGINQQHHKNMSRKRRRDGYSQWH